MRERQWVGWATLIPPSLVSVLAGHHGGLVLGGMVAIVAMTYSTAYLLVLATREDPRSGSVTIRTPLFTITREPDPTSEKPKLPELPA
jgi:hypothetical protein